MSFFFNYGRIKIVALYKAVITLRLYKFAIRNTECTCMQVLKISDHKLLESRKATYIKMQYISSAVILYYGLMDL